MLFVGSFCHLNKCVISADENRSLQQCRLSNIYKLKIITSLLLLCRQIHPPPPNQQPPQELTVTTVMTQSCEETKLCQEQQKRNLPNLFFSSSLLFHLSELGCSKEYQNHKGLQTLAAINTSV